MGYLNKDVVTVDAILTKRGRELLSQGQGGFRITKFAVADDEIDYGLYDFAHPLGSEYYGSAIENMPIVEASPDDAQGLRYKLTTLDRGFFDAINQIPTLTLSNQATSIILEVGQTNAAPIIPETTAGTNKTLDQSLGYTAILYDASIATLIVDQAATSGPASVTANDNVSVAVGKTFSIVPNAGVTTLSNTTLVITGNESGATISIPVTVKPRLV